LDKVIGADADEERVSSAYGATGYWKGEAELMVYGMKVTQRILNHDTDEIVRQVLRNVTEIHYRYPRPGGDLRKRVAFESNIHRTGITYSVEGGGILEIIEFEAVPETELAEEF